MSRGPTSFERGQLGHTLVATIGMALVRSGMTRLCIFLPDSTGKTFDSNFSSVESAKEFAEKFVEQWLRATHLEKMK